MHAGSGDAGVCPDVRNAFYKGSDPGSVTVAWRQTYTKDDCYLMVNDALPLKEKNDNVYNESEV